jgi:hypothetical protein
MPASIPLARFLHLRGMDLFQSPLKRIPFEDWIEPMCRLALVVLLLATLGRLA